MDNHDIKDTETARKYFDSGRKAEELCDRIGAIEAYEVAFAADPEDFEICFRLAYNLDLVGEEDEAVHLYEQTVQQPNPPLNALLNLAVLYEDRNQHVKAERCIKQVLSTDPNHPRACLFIKDIQASSNMIIDDESDQKIEQHNALLDTPVTDFDLSVRTRNALRKMSVRTLGDMLRVTEADLRSYKNVGDASLEEIRAMLAQRGLRLGQAVEQQKSATDQAVYEQLKNDAGPNDSSLGRSVNELQLSVRARKALALLNIQAIGDLCMRTEAELMGVKNFGLTSLLEIKEKLAESRLSLRTLEDEQ
ncbi:MAG: DNA-directed RNA polymerase subunit alpha C-terminal domain-containing protein [Pirellulaceae bacterium]|nr:DNA-directed RNA polymerase subunit alpha C-terminal domain-containing protein [Pirellulaceae bacterium]